tara:strand:- start:2106 stop:3185 length:1080 start_codon:yes stop_codon:yes gene_type:complete
MNKDIKNFISIAGVVLIILLIIKMKSIVIYFIIGAIISFIGRPVMNKLSDLKIFKKNIPSGLSAIFTIILILSCFVGITSLFLPLALEQAKVISAINITEVTENFKEPINTLNEKLNRYDVSFNKHEVDDKINTLIKSTNISNLINGFIGMLGNIYLAIFATLFISFFFLKDKFLLRKIVFSIITENKHNKAKNALINAKYLLSRYFIGILIQISCVTFLATMGLTILGVENAIVIGFFAGLTNIIPYIGPIIGSFVGLTLSIITNLHLAPELMLPFALKIMLIFMITQIIDNMILQPTIFARSVKAHPLEIFSIVMIGFQVGGLGGMIIAIPFYTLFRIFAKEFLSEFEFIKNITKNI